MIIILAIVVAVAVIAYSVGKHNEKDDQKRKKYFLLRTQGVPFSEATSQSGYVPTPVEEPERHPGDPYVVRNFSEKQRNEWKKLPD
jgi:hypothetical protein